MEDEQIVRLYWERKEAAIDETQSKYQNYLMSIAYHVLFDEEDSKESVNDTYLKAWNSMPPHKPNRLSCYLGKITREVSIDRYRRKNSQKRGGSEYALSLSELEECVSGESSPETQIELQLLADSISAYLRTLPEKKRNIFICRYYFLDSIKEIAAYQGASESKIKSSLHRIRMELKEYLKKEGFFV